MTISGLFLAIVVFLCLADEGELAALLLLMAYILD